MAFLRGLLLPDRLDHLFRSGLLVGAWMIDDYFESFGGTEKILGRSKCLSSCEGLVKAWKFASIWLQVSSL